MRVLIIAEAFPPNKSPRALQMAKVVDALFEAGCEVRVMAGLAENEMEMASWRFPVQYVDSDKSRVSGALGRLSNRVLDSRLWCQWARKTRDACLQLMKDFRPDIILTVSNPYHSHYVGLLLHRRNSIPWVAFFSDPYPPALLPAAHRWHTGTIRHLWDMRFIRKVLKGCSGVVMTNSYALHLMERKMGIKIQDKSFVIPHVGSEPEKKIRCTDGCLVHIGNLTNRECPPLLEAVKQVASEMPKRFKGLVCVGRGYDEFRRIAREKNMEHLVTFIGQVSACKASQIAAGSHALLVIEADMPESPFLPSKFADYCMTGRPIIAITPPMSSIRDYLTEYGGGVAVSHSVQEIAKAIRYVFSNSCSYHEGEKCSEAGGLSSVFQASAVAASYMQMFEKLCHGT